MKTSMVLIFALFTLSSFAEALRIVDILPPEGKDENYLILASDGRVYELSASNTEVLREVMDAHIKREAIEIETSKLNLNSFLNSREQISYVKKSSTEFYSPNKGPKGPTPTENFDPTIFEGSAETMGYFKSMRTDMRGRSECYNRAYVWNYELWKRFDVKSRKVFLFFTRKYIREFNYNWWFHVAPLAKVNTGSKMEEVVLDRQFFREPKLQEDWKNNFLYNHAPCPEVTKYSDYSEHQYEAYCYFIKASMYYWQPLDIENLEKTGVQQTDWNEWKLNTAYRDAIR